MRLQTTPQGVSAQLVADSPEAARMLSQASDDLRRSLEARDVNLLSLDVSTSATSSREAPGRVRRRRLRRRAFGPGGRATRAPTR